MPSRATVTSKPSRASPMTRASMKDSSSSASSTLVWLWSDGGDSVGPSDALSEAAFSDELGLLAEWAFPLLSARSVLALMRRTPVDWAG